MVIATTDKVDITELKARHPLGDAVEAAGIVLHGRGRVRQGVCPFHEEAEGSFTVYGDSQRYYCFGCGAGGDVLDFVGRMEGLTLPQAIRRLDDGSTPPASSHRATAAPSEQPATPAIPPRDSALLTAAARFYGGQLRRNRAAMQYLASRGIGLDTARRLGLGYAPGNGLREYLQAAGFTAQWLRASGLFLERGAERFAGMVVVPELSDGLVVWLVGRAIDGNAKPRFQALAGPKPVLGLARLGPAPSCVVLTEGVFDWLTLTLWGHPAVAALGTKGMDKVAAALHGCPRVFLAFDNDDAGNQAAEELKGLLGNRAAVVNLPEGVGDVGELATLPDGRLRFPRLLARAAANLR